MIETSPGGSQEGEFGGARGRRGCGAPHTPGGRPVLSEHLAAPLCPGAHTFPTSGQAAAQECREGKPAVREQRQPRRQSLTSARRERSGFSVARWSSLPPPAGGAFSRGARRPELGSRAHFSHSAEELVGWLGIERMNSYHVLLSWWKRHEWGLPQPGPGLCPGQP